MMPEHLWTVKDLAAYAGVTTKTVYVWRREGEGPPAFRVGKYIRYRPADVAEWLESHRQDQPGTS